MLLYLIFYWTSSVYPSLSCYPFDFSCSFSYFSFWFHHQSQHLTERIFIPHKNYSFLLSVTARRFVLLPCTPLATLPAFILSYLSANYLDTKVQWRYSRRRVSSLLFRMIFHSVIHTGDEKKNSVRRWQMRDFCVPSFSTRRERFKIVTHLTHYFYDPCYKTVDFFSFHWVIFSDKHFLGRTKYKVHR